jgi:hypothetical protein
MSIFDDAGTWGNLSSPRTHRNAPCRSIASPAHPSCIKHAGLRCRCLGCPSTAAYCHYRTGKELWLLAIHYTSVVMGSQGANAQSMFSPDSICVSWRSVLLETNKGARLGLTRVAYRIRTTCLIYRKCTHCMLRVQAVTGDTGFECRFLNFH